MFLVQSIIFLDREYFTAKLYAVLTDRVKNQYPIKNKAVNRSDLPHFGGRMNTLATFESLLPVFYNNAFALDLIVYANFAKTIF